MIRSLSVQVLLALGLGLALGAMCQAWGDARATVVIANLEAVGGLWLNALRMTVVPLVFALIVVGVASVADAAATGRLAVRAIVLFAVLIAAATVYAVLASLGALALWPVDAASAAAFRAGVHGAGGEIAAAPSFAQWLAALAPANPIRAAAEDAILPLVVFGLFVGFAATRLPQGLRDALVTLMRAVAETMIVIVGWVLKAAPVGVFALALGVGSRAGAGAAGVLAHYVIVVSLVTIGVTLLAYPLAALLGGVSLGRFARAAAPAQVVAFSTQSSLATLPAMVQAARERLGVSDRVTDLVLPLAVAVFRLTSPVANLAVAFFIAAIYGIEVDAARIAGAMVVAFAISIGSVGLPGQISFFASMAPICLALGVPTDLLAILLAVEVAPDIFRTVGNVTGDLVATVIVHRAARDDALGTQPAAA